MIADDLILRVANKHMLSGRKPVYIGVFLSSSAHAELLRHFPPIDPDVHAHHMSLFLKPSVEQLQEVPLGLEVRIDVVGYAEDDQGQAVLVRPHGVSPAGRIPHITISTANGVAPVYSNQLLMGDVMHVHGPTLEGVVDTFPRSF